MNLMATSKGTDLKSGLTDILFSKNVIITKYTVQFYILSSIISMNIIRAHLAHLWITQNLGRHTLTQYKKDLTGILELSRNGSGIISN